MSLDEPRWVAKCEGSPKALMPSLSNNLVHQSLATTSGSFTTTNPSNGRHQIVVPRL